MDRKHFVSEWNRLYYGEGSPLPVPKYRLDAAMQAILDVITSRARAGGMTWWEHVGTFTPYVRPGYVRSVRKERPVDYYPFFQSYREQMTIPAKTCLYFRPSKPTKALDQFLMWGLEGGGATYTGEPDGAYKLGRQAVWVAVKGVLSEVVKKPGADEFFTRGYDETGNARWVASDYFVSGFLLRLGAAIQRIGRADLRGWGSLRGWNGVYKWLPHPVTGVQARVQGAGGCWSYMSKSLNLDAPEIPVT